MRSTDRIGGFLAVSLLVSLLTGHTAAQTSDEAGQGSRVQQLERKVDALEQQVRALGGARSRSNVVDANSRLGQEPARKSEPSVRICGRLDFEFYDTNAQRSSFGVYGGNAFGANGGATQYRVRRMQLSLGMDLIEDLVFHSLLTLDPVVRDEDEGAVDIDEAYIRFGHVGRNLFGFEDPTNTFIQAGNYFRWERDFLPRHSESFSLAGTAFYRDEVTGIQIGGDTEEGLFYRLSMDNGSVLGARDAGVGQRAGAGGIAVGNSPMIHDNEQRGDLNDNKDFALGLGYQTMLEGPELQFAVAFSARAGRSSRADRAFLATVSPGRFDGSRNKTRFGVLGMVEWDLEQVILGLSGEGWVGKDGNASRDSFSLSPYVRLPLDGVYYEERRFFTHVGAAYRFSYLHQSKGLANSSSLATMILADRHGHTLSVWLEVTNNVNLRLEMNNNDSRATGVGTETEWLLQWGVRF